MLVTVTPTTRVKSRRSIAVIALMIVIVAAIFVATQSFTENTASNSSSPSLSIIILSPQTDPFVDSSCLGASNSLNNNACKISTTHDPDLIIAELGTGSSASKVSSISDGSGLKWSLYAHYTLTGSGPKSLFVYYAIASSLLSSDNVSVKYTGSGTNGIVVMAVNNYDAADPFDPSKTPATSSSSTATTSIHVSPVSTVDSDELLLGLFAVQSNPTVTAGTGFTSLPHSNTPTVYAEWEQLSAPVTDLSVGATLSSAQVFLGTAFGVVPAPVSTTTTTVTTTTTITTSTSLTSTSAPTTTSSTSKSTTTTTSTSQTTTSASSTTSSTSTKSTTTTSTITSTSTSLTVTASSVGNACFVNNYDSNIITINAIYWECGATLQGSQSIKQNIFRSSELYGSFTLSVNASQTITIMIVANGDVIFSKTGTSITFSGSVTQNEPMYVTISNSEATDTSYKLGIDWTDV